MDNLIAQDFELPSTLCERTSILWLMAKAGHEGCEQSVCLLQESINHLAGKAERLCEFSDAEKLFLCTVFDSPWWGGVELGLNESRSYGSLSGDQLERLVTGDRWSNNLDPVQQSMAMLAQHYIHGDGQCFPLSLPVYKSSKIVCDTLAALKSYIAELQSLNKPATFVSSTDSGFLLSKFASYVEQTRAQSDVMGYIFRDGSLMLEQKDPRILNPGNRFKITAMTTAMGTFLLTRWRIEGRYCFETFQEGAATLLPLNQQHALRIPYILATYMVAQNIAQPFDYFADWAEKYALFKLNNI